MGKIVLLDDLTINQIAAGEVIERPASVVKELVENSIDAGAKNITVEIKNGGISYIRINDDGSGILPDDMEIAFERHATSKIRQADDLDTVKSMGFRGEALASISAISKVELVSKAEGNDKGYRIYVEGGDIKDKTEYASSKGTSITVKDLFYNTPVRYKFLRKDFTEAGYIEEAIQRIALANPDVAIKLVDSGKTTIQTNGSGKLEETIYQIYGKQTVDNLLPVDYTYEEYHVTGVLGKPILSRSNRTNELFYVNKRFIKDKTLTSAADQGFKGLVTVGKHGFLILNIDMDPKKVDVNVHPTKLEVRFQEESKVFKAVYHAIKETLLKGNLISDPNKDYSDSSENTINQNITNSTRVKAWNILDNDNKPKEEEKSQDIPNFSEFKETIKGLSKEEKEELLDKAKNASNKGEIINTLNDLKNKSMENSKIENKEKDSIDDKNADVKNRENNIETKVDEVDNDFEINPDGISDDNQEIKITGMVDDDNTESEKISDSEKVENQEVANGDETSETTKETEKTEIEDEDSKLNQEQPEKTYDDSTLDLEQAEKSDEEKEKEEEISFEEMYKKLFKKDLSEAQAEYTKKLEEQDAEYPIKPLSGEEISMFEQDGLDKNPKYTFVGIAFKTYIILTLGDDLYMVDQHAAHERIMYEKVKANYNNDTNKDSQLMLVPDIINLSNKEMGIFKDNKEMFNKAGFVADEFGDNTVKLTGVPEFCLKFNTQEIFLETLDEIDTVARTAKQEVEDKFLATIACKAAVKAHMALTKEEVDSLLAQLMKLPNPFSCPHGRPTIIKMSKTDIEKKFSRRL